MYTWKQYKDKKNIENCKFIINNNNFLKEDRVEQVTCSSVREFQVEIELGRKDIR